MMILLSQISLEEVFGDCTYLSTICNVIIKSHLIKYKQLQLIQQVYVLQKKKKKSGLCFHMLSLPFVKTSTRGAPFEKNPNRYDFYLGDKLHMIF